MSLEQLRCDVLVCGAGPAGASAALAAASRGARVLVLEKRERVGVPVRCAEYIPAPLLGRVPADAGCIAQKTVAMRAYLHGTCFQELQAPGCLVHRDRFDQALAQAAVEAGATLLAGHRVQDLEDGQTVRVLAPDGRLQTIRASVVIGADGPLSRVARYVDPVSRQLLPALQLRLPLLEPLDHTRVYFDESLPAGYAWLFPKQEVANVGLGIVPDPGESLVRKLQRFVDRLADEGLVARQDCPGGKHRPLLTGGWIPVEERPCHKDTVLLCGDAAGHTHPITGAGIFQAVLAGEMAGRWAGEALACGSLARLRNYAEEWQDEYGDVLRHARARRLAWQAHRGALDGVIRSFWIGNREYYAARQTS